LPLLHLNDGGSLDYSEAGSGLPILLLHGWGLGKDAFSAQLRGLGSRFRLIAPDLRGHGASSTAPRNDGIAALADDARQLLESLDLDNVVVVGWSMGAMVAWQLLQGAAADRISGLVVIDMVPRILSDDDWPHGLRQGVDASVFDLDVQRMLESWESYVAEFVPRNVARGREQARGPILARLREIAAANDVGSMARLWRSLADQDMRETATRLTIPTLIVYGERGQLYGAGAFQWMTRQIPHSRCVGFADSGHAPQLEEPDRFNALLAEFVSEIQTGSTETANNRSITEPERPS